MRTLATLCGVLGSCLLLSCSSPTGPSADGPAFLQATINGHKWVSDRLDVSAALRAGSHLLVNGGQPPLMSGYPPNILTVATRITGPGQWIIPAAGDGEDDGAAYSGRITPGDPLNQWITDSLHTGELVISQFDTVAKMVTGTFSFSARSSDGTVITVTDGSFRAKYYVFP